MDSRKKGTLYVFMAAVLYSIGGLCMKVIPWNAVAINGARTGIALIVIGLYLVATKHRLRFNRYIALGAVSVFATNLLFALANKMTTAANAIVLQFTAPIFVIVCSALFFRKKPVKLDLAACAVVFSGIVFFFVDSLSVGGGLGNLFALISGLSYAIVFMLNELPDGDPISSIFWGDILSAVVGLPFLLQETDFSAVSVISILVLGIFQVALGYIFLTIGLRTTPAVTASLVSGIEPVLNPVLVAIFYGEKVSAFAIVGAFIVIAGVLTYNVLKGKEMKIRNIKENENETV